MTSVMVAWVRQSAEAFERQVPIRWGGERNRRMGSRNGIHLLFLEGLQALASEYREQLTETGYLLVDGSESYGHHRRRHSQLEQFGDYEQKCFLRWLVIRDLFGTSPVMHFDGDVVFNALPEDIERDLGDATFVLQGCPALVSTGRSDWLAEYTKQLDLFHRDVAGYSETAWRERPGWELSHQQKWSGSRFRRIIGSDQDLISHLIHTDRLPQDRPEEIERRTDLLLFENPLYFFSCHAQRMPVVYSREQGVDYFSEKKVAFWHMQSDFVWYLRMAMLRGWLNRISRCPNHVERFRVEAALWRTLARLGGARRERLGVYRHYFDASDFGPVFNDKAFWKPSVFRT